MTITATYSPEDNKLRIYSSSHLDDETYSRVRDAGFKWAPRQELFVAPRWTPDREDLCIELAGEIEPESTTMAERAEAKIERLDQIINNSAKRANSFRNVADSLSERFYMGQPILIGHHSERRARKDQERVHSNMRKATHEVEKQNYYQSKAKGVAYHANKKNNPIVRARRIKTLLADLRERQRVINEADKMLQRLISLKTLNDREKRHAILKGLQYKLFRTSTYYDQAISGELSWDDYLDKAIKAWEAAKSAPRHQRWLIHMLNRLAYEQDMLGTVKRFDGTITAATLQTFARTHGAEKPKAKKDGQSWTVISPITLPIHIGEGANDLTLTEDGWRDLMQATGYAVPEKKPAMPPILNFKADSITVQRWGSQETLTQIEMTKEEYSAINPDYRHVRTSICGEFRIKTAPDPTQSGIGRAWRAVFLTDSKVHDMPESVAINSHKDDSDA